MQDGTNDDSGMVRLGQMKQLQFDQIRRLGELHKDGFLTDEEYSKKKAEMLERIR